LVYERIFKKVLFFKKFSVLLPRENSLESICGLEVIQSNVIFYIFQAATGSSQGGWR
jgi:hypothetical protein